jgi:hypothetical protein
MLTIGCNTKENGAEKREFYDLWVIPSGVTVFWNSTVTSYPSSGYVCVLCLMPPHFYGVHRGRDFHFLPRWQIKDIGGRGDIQLNTGSGQRKTCGISYIHRLLTLWELRSISALNEAENSRPGRKASATFGRLTKAIAKTLFSVQRCSHDS